MATTRAVLTPLSAEFPASAYAALTTVNARPALAFDAATDESVLWTFIAWQGISGALTAVLTLSGNAASANSTYWEVSLEAVGAGESATTDSFATVNTGNVAMDATQGETSSLSITLTNDDSIAAGDLVRIRVTRDANHASDNFAADAYLYAVEIREA